MRRLLRPLWFLLAVLFLVEEWLWDHLVPAIRLIVDAIPWRAFKTWLAGRIERLSPQATLVVFLIPAAIYFGLELLALWPMAYGRWLLALIVLGVAMVLWGIERSLDEHLRLGEDGRLGSDLVQLAGILLVIGGAVILVRTRARWREWLRTNHPSGSVTTRKGAEQPA